MATRRQAVDNSPAFRWIVKIIYIVYLALYTAYALYNFLHDEGDILINVLVISFTSVSALILIITTVMDYVVKDNETLSTAKVTLHTLKNIFKVIKVAISVIVLIQTINDNSWSVFNIIVVVMSLPLSLLLLLIEYVYVSIANSVRNRRKGAISLDDFDDEEMAAALLAAKNQQNKRSSAEFWASLLTWELTGYEDIDDISDTYDAVRAAKLQKKLLPDNYVEPEPILEEELAELRYIRRAVSRNAKTVRRGGDEKSSSDGADCADIWPRVVPSEGKIYPVPNALITLSRPRKKAYDRRKGARKIQPTAKLYRRSSRRLNCRAANRHSRIRRRNKI